MHTSTRISASDFRYSRLCASRTTEVSFEEVFPDYHPQDRVGMVVPVYEDGIVYGTAALLSLTTRFYDIWRARTETFFDYPQHFAFIAGIEKRISTGIGSMRMDSEEMGASWGWLDVWPETNWIVTLPDAPSMLMQILSHQINRLIWPETLSPHMATLPEYVSALLRSRLKSVWYYGGQTADMEIRLSGAAADVAREALDRLPARLRERAKNEVEGKYRIGEVEGFVSAI
ncbi:MAG: hypothetical protein FJY97_13995 [candidate division Zixibacteria bacterium]|nr:hypothetical protein [candidate division Zixibacteria bacterium]